jgi:diacylglycerol O-acyltransferase
MREHGLSILRARWLEPEDKVTNGVGRWTEHPRTGVVGVQVGDDTGRRVDLDAADGLRQPRLGRGREGTVGPGFDAIRPWHGAEEEPMLVTAMNTSTLDRYKPERLSMVDNAWLHMEMPTNLMMVGSLVIFDAAFDREQLLAMLRTRLLNHPRFVQRIEASPLGPPRWVPDRMFDLNAHVHSVALPAPGGDGELRTLVGDLMSSPLDMSRPLWDAHLIENYHDGAVMLTRIHHCIADGTALIHVLLGLTGTTAVASLRAPRHPSPSRDGEAGIHLPSLDPRHALDGMVELGAHAFELARLSAMWPDASTPLRGDLVRTKQVAWTEPFPLDSLRTLRTTSGCTVNDVLVTAVTGALRTYIRQRDAAVPPFIRALVPVDMRPGTSDGTAGNQFGLVFIDMPVGLARRMGRLRAVHDRMNAARRSPQPSVTFEVLGALGLVPQAVRRQVVRFFGSKATAVVTNVRGPEQELYLAGRRLRHMTFFVPQSAMLGIGVSIMTYAGQIQMGVIADAGLVPDPLVITRGVTEELRQLIKS